jgi:hypothetical protein
MDAISLADARPRLVAGGHFRAAARIVDQHSLGLRAGDGRAGADAGMIHALSHSAGRGRHIDRR